MSQQRITCGGEEGSHGPPTTQETKGGRNKESAKNRKKRKEYRTVASYWLEEGVCQLRTGGLHIWHRTHTCPFIITVASWTLNRDVLISPMCLNFLDITEL